MMMMVTTTMMMILMTPPGGPGQRLLPFKRSDKPSVPRCGHWQKQKQKSNIIKIVRTGKRLRTWPCFAQHPARPRVWDSLLQQVPPMKNNQLCLPLGASQQSSNISLIILGAKVAWTKLPLLCIDSHIFRWREWCGLSVMTSWEDLLEVVANKYKYKY